MTAGSTACGKGSPSNGEAAPVSTESPVAAVDAAPEALSKLSFPDTMLVDQSGKDVRIYSDLIRGRTVAINFVFTSCTAICPTMGVTFAKLQTDLAHNGPPNVLLLSVSIDPATDTPERLAAFRDKVGGKPGWTLLTGPKPEVDALLKAVQAFTPDFQAHSPMVLMGNDRSGRWVRANGLAPASQLATMLRQLESAPKGAQQ